MIESKFNKAYLQIIKEDYDGFLPKDDEVPALAENEEAPASDTLKQVTFVTSDQTLIDAINSGFEEIVLFTNAKDETTGEDTIVEVKIGKDSFGDIVVTNVEEDEDQIGDDEVEECGGTEGGDEDSVEGEETEIEEDTEDGGDEGSDDGGDEGSDDGGDEGSVEGEETEIEEGTGIDPSEWVEDGVCVKCQSAECDGSCKCEKCGDVNCIGDC